MAHRDTDVFDRLERFYDAVPRDAAVAEEIGGFVLFVREGEGWPFYARPRPGADTPSAADITAVRRRQRELGIPEAFEAVEDVVVVSGMRHRARLSGRGVAVTHRKL